MSTDIGERKSLRELRESKETLFAQNNTPHKITCNSDKVSFELDPHEIRVMPKECLAEPGLQKLWRRNSVTISDDPEMENKIDLGSDGVVNGLRPVTVVLDDGTEKIVTPTLEEPPNRRDLVFTATGDPAGRDYRIEQPKCLIGGEPVFQTEQQVKMGNPPLCPLHDGEQHRIMSTPQPDGTWRHEVAKVTIEPTKKTT